MTDFPCNSCGASLRFTPGAQTLACPYCGSRNDIPAPAAEARIEEKDFDQELAVEGDFDGNYAEINYQCRSCAASFTLSDSVLSGQCGFCQTPYQRQPEEKRAILPQAVLPFRLDQKAALQSYRTWIGSRWFAPNSLEDLARVKAQLLGHYLPHWTIDAEVDTRYTGSRGEHYWDTESYTDSQGNRQTRQVRRTRWYPAAGEVTNSFDDILIVAAPTDLPREYARALEPWKLSDLVPYDPSYLAGFTARAHGLPLPKAFAEARDLVAATITSSVKDDIGGDEQIVLTQQSRWYDMSCKAILLPVWYMNYRHGDKVYKIAVNAITGEVQGQRPWSGWKICAAIIFGLIIIALIIGGVSMLKQH